MTAVAKKALPFEITSYDLLKMFALVTMIIDHIGMYFYPEVLWWRAVGRLSAPAWFFLIGYSVGRKIPKKLWIGACFLELVDVALGGGLFVLNVLFTIIVMRFVIDPIMQLSLRAWPYLVGVLVVLLALIPASYSITEYGTQALIVAMFGYVVRHKSKIDNRDVAFFFMALEVGSYVLIQQLLFKFDHAAFLFVAIGGFVLRSVLCFFTSQTYPVLTQKMPKIGVLLIQLCGRHTLEVYVFHLILFKVVALALGSPDYQLFDLRLFNVE